MSEPSVDTSTTTRRPRSATGRFVLFAVAAALFCVYVGLIRSHRAGAENHPAVGRKLERLELEPLTGATADLSLADLQGKVVLLNFWGTWCGPCGAEFPHLVELATRLRNQPDFQLVSVSVDDSASLSELRRETAGYLAERGSEMPTYADLRYWTRQNLQMVLDEQIGYPTTVILDRQGVIRGVFIGYQSGYEKQMLRLAEDLLAQPAKS